MYILLLVLYLPELYGPQGDSSGDEGLSSGSWPSEATLGMLPISPFVCCFVAIPHATTTRLYRCLPFLGLLSWPGAWVNQLASFGESCGCIWLGWLQRSPGLVDAAVMFSIMSSITSSSVLAVE